MDSTYGNPVHSTRKFEAITEQMISFGLEIESEDLIYVGHIHAIALSAYLAKIDLGAGSIVHKALYITNIINGAFISLSQSFQVGYRHQWWLVPPGSSPLYSERYAYIQTLDISNTCTTYSTSFASLGITLDAWETITPFAHTSSTIRYLFGIDGRNN